MSIVNNPRAALRPFRECQCQKSTPRSEVDTTAIRALRGRGRAVGSPRRKGGNARIASLTGCINMHILMCMATKNVYVSDHDVELFETAAEYAGSMSAAVAAGLRLYVTQQEKARGDARMREIEIEVRDGPVVTTKRFWGRRILRYDVPNGIRIITYDVYLTGRDQLAVYTRDHPDWSKLSSADEDHPTWTDPQTWKTGWWKTTERSLRVFPDVDGMVGDVPDELINSVNLALTTPSIEELDI